MKKVNHGGFRAGSGRKLGSGSYGEPTTVMRVPQSKATAIRQYIMRKLSYNINTIFTVPSELGSQPLPWFSHKVPAGFPSPADDHVEKRLDPNEFLIDQADATFFVTIQGESMIDVGLMPGDKAVVDRSKMPSIGDIVLAVVDGDFTIKVLNRGKDGSPRLLPANASGKYQPIEIKENMTFEVWGVVTGSFRRFK